MTAGVVRYNPALGVKLHRVATSVVDSPGLPIYTDLLEGFAKHLNVRIKNHYQNVVAFVGGTGSGKSTAAIEVCFAVDPYFTFKDNYIYSTEDLARKLAKPFDRISPVNLLDEGSVILNSNKHSTKEATDMTVIFDTMRSRGMTTLICIPELRSLNNRIRDDHLNYLVVCGEKAPIPGYSKRGFCKLFMRTRPSTFKNSVFWKPIGWGVYDPLPKDIDAEYQEYKKRAQNRLLDDFYSRTLEGEA